MQCRPAAQSGVVLNKFLAVTAALFIASGAFAQTAPSDQPDPTKLELARQLFAASGGQAQAQASLHGMFAGMGKLMAQIVPSDRGAIAQAFQADMEDAAASVMPQIWDLSIRAYARNLSEKELRDYLAWEQSESGQSIQRKLPLLKEQLIESEAPILAEMMPRLMQRSLERACDINNCTPEERRSIGAQMAKALRGQAS